MTLAVASGGELDPASPRLRAELILVPMRWSYLRCDGGRARPTLWHLVPARASRDRALCGASPRPFAVVREWHPGSPATRSRTCDRCRRAALALVSSLDRVRSIRSGS